MPAAETPPALHIESRIYLIRGQKVLLDRDLARLYQVKPIALRQAQALDAEEATGGPTAKPKAGTKR